jgi:oligopeptidase B
MEAPQPQRIIKELQKHGDSRVDPYFWMNEREDTKLLDFLNQENAYFESKYPKDGLRKQIFDEIVAKVKKDDDTVPYLKRGYFHQTTYSDESEYPVYHRKKANSDVDEVVLDVNVLAKEEKYCEVVGGSSYSPDDKILAYGIDTVGRRIYKIKFLNLETRVTEEIVLEGTTGRFVFQDDKMGYYSTKDAALRPHKIMKHVRGTSNADDECIYEEKDEKFRVHIGKQITEKYLTLGSYASITSEQRVLNLENPEKGWQVVAERKEGIEYSIEHDAKRNRFIILTNWDAKNFRVMEVSEDKLGSRDNWVELIPHQADTHILSADAFANHLVITERKNGQVNIRVIDHNTNTDAYVVFDEEIRDIGLQDNFNYDTDTLRMSYSSLTTPISVIDYNMNTKERKVMKQKEVLNFDKNNYQSKKVITKTHDGKELVLSLVYRQDNPLKNVPFIIYGYGSYGHTIDPYLSIARLPLLDRGFGYAIAHIRGGAYFGRQWYDDGKLLNKKNTFLDFISCSEKLIEDGYTSADRLFGWGGSAGGLLMGAISNMRPDLYQGIISMVPFVDVLTTMLDDTIPLTVGEYDEWGNPNVEEYYQYIKSYSPYDNIEAKKYPNMFISTGFHDSQVQYWEPAKYVAKLREVKTDQNTIVFHVDMEAGHGGSAGRFKRFEDYADAIAFVLSLTNSTCKL